MILNNGVSWEAVEGGSGGPLDHPSWRGLVMATAGQKIETHFYFFLPPHLMNPILGPAYLNLITGVSREAILGGPGCHPDHSSRRCLGVAAAVCKLLSDLYILN